MKYPVKHMKGKAIKRALGALLLAPVQACGDCVHAFRVGWRVDDEGLAQAWSAIVSRRHACDQIVAQTPSLQMFVSCITGMTKVRVRGTSSTATMPVYPAVSYWAVFDRADNGGYLMQRLMAMCPAAQVKKIQSCQTGRDDESTAAARLTLFTVLKDHSSSFVSHKISPILVASDAAQVEAHPPNAKLAVMPQSKYLGILPESMRELNSVGLCMYLDVLEGH